MRYDRAEATARYLPPRDRTQMADERRAALGLTATAVDENSVDVFYIGAMWTDRGLAFVGDAGTAPAVYPLMIQALWAPGRNFVFENWADGDAEPAWAPTLTDWPSRFPIATIAPGKRLENYPLYLSGTGMPAGLWTTAQASGNDLVFALDDGTVLAHDLVHFVPASTAMEAHVLLPVFGLGGAQVYCYIGNATCGAQSNAAGVWAASYVSVHHLGEASGNYADSTGHGWTGTDNVAPGGKVGQLFATGGETFDGTGDNIALDPTIGAALSGLGAAHASMWFKRNTTGIASYLLYTTASTSNARIQVRFDAADKIYVVARGDSTAVSRLWTTTAAYADTASWHHLLAVVDIEKNDMQIYLDGAQVADDGGTGGWVAETFDNASGTGGNIATATFAGILDEVRFGYGTRSLEWAATEVANQSSPATFYTCGAIEAQ